MRILFFHRWVGVHAGGTEAHLKELAFRLAKRGHEVHILTREGRELNDTTHVKVWRVPKTLWESDFSYEDLRVYLYTAIYVAKAFLMLLYLKFRGIDYDVVSVHFTTEAFLMRLTRKIFGWPYVFILEGYTDAEASEAKHADLQIAISCDIAIRCRKNFGYSPLVVPVGVDLERFTHPAKNIMLKQRYARKGENLILTVCRLEPRKDIPTLIDAAKIVSKANSGINFIIVGNGIKRHEIEERITASNLERVFLTGQVSDEQLPSYYKIADLFVLPTLYEGFGIVLLEAMASGLPIISTTAQAVPEVVGDAGILVLPKNPELLAEEILRVIGDKDLRKSLSESGLERVKRYSWNNLIVEYERAYISISEMK